jgi:hypothetical protein
MLVTSCAWVVAPWSYHADLLANLSAQMLLVTSALLVLALALRRWRLSAMLAVACMLVAWPMCIGSGWAIRASLLPKHSTTWTVPAPPDFDPAAAQADSPLDAIDVAARAAYDADQSRRAASGGLERGVIRLMHFNASSKKRAEQLLAHIATCGADVVAITEPDWRMQSWVFSGDDGLDMYPYRLERRFSDTDLGAGAGFMLSRFPIEEFDPRPAPPLGAGVDIPNEFMVGVVTVVPGASGRETRCAIIAMHPRSPRSARRWAHGNEVALAAATIARTLRERDNLPVILVGDINASPSGWRSRLCEREGGLRRTKPLLDLSGTYPSSLPWPLRVSIDDAVVSPDIKLVSWRAGAGEDASSLGSDHLPIYLELRLPTRK